MVDRGVHVGVLLQRLVPVVALALVAGVAAVPGPAGPTPDDTRPAAASACGPLRSSEVVGQRPSYLPRELTRFWGDEAICRGRWLGGRSGRFVPQGIAVSGKEIWVSGYDGDQDDSGAALTCRVFRLERPSLRVLDVQAGIDGRLADGTPTSCRHGGGIAVDGARLWVMDSARLFLLARSRFGRADAVRRVWRLTEGVRGSTGMLHPTKGLGLGRYSVNGSGRVDWYDPDALVASSSGSIGPSMTVDAVRNRLQGLSFGALRSAEPRGTWMTYAGPGCGVLVGPAGQRVPVAVGIEGLSFDGQGGAWLLSEASVLRYWGRGGPVIPMVLRYSVARLAEQTTLPGGIRRAEECLSRLG